MLESPQVRFLNDVLGFSVLAQDAACHAEQALIVPTHDLLERGHVSLKNALREFLIGCCLAGDGRIVSGLQHALTVLANGMTRATILRREGLRSDRAYRLPRPRPSLA